MGSLLLDIPRDILRHCIFPYLEGCDGVILKQVCKVVNSMVTSDYRLNSLINCHHQYCDHVDVVLNKWSKYKIPKYTFPAIHKELHKMGVSRISHANDFSDKSGMMWISTNGHMYIQAWGFDLDAWNRVIAQLKEIGCFKWHLYQFPPVSTSGPKHKGLCVEKGTQFLLCVLWHPLEWYVEMEPVVQVDWD